MPAARELSGLAWFERALFGGGSGAGYCGATVVLLWCYYGATEALAAAATTKTCISPTDVLTSDPSCYGIYVCLRFSARRVLL